MNFPEIKKNQLPSVSRDITNKKLNDLIKQVEKAHATYDKALKEAETSLESLNEAAANVANMAFSWLNDRKNYDDKQYDAYQDVHNAAAGIIKSVKR